jgi:SAM-dependent methyltransferase
MSSSLEASPARRANVGCGVAVTPGWHNFDNSLSVRLARWPLLTRLLARLGLLGDEQLEFIATARAQGVRWANSVRTIPLPDDSLEVVYTCHMLEHLDREEARSFLAEARRVLEPGGVLRAAVPDLQRLAESYLVEGDADSFVERSLLASPPLRTLPRILRFLITGDRYHQWMYDGPSLLKLLTEAGFESPRVLSPGETTLGDPGELDLYERQEESVYVEAVAP